jgi:hypothetical protein
MGYGKSRWDDRPNPFENIPTGGKPIKSIYVNDDGKVVIEYDDLLPEGEESEES